VLLRGLVADLAPLNGTVAMCLAFDERSRGWTLQLLELKPLGDDGGARDKGLVCGVEPEHMRPLRWLGDVGSSGTQLGMARTLVARRLVQLRATYSAGDRSVGCRVGVVHVVSFTVEGGELAIVQLMGNGEKVRASPEDLYCTKMLCTTCE
jgi:hypothetical protein